MYALAKASAGASVLMQVLVLLATACRSVWGAQGCILPLCCLQRSSVRGGCVLIWLCLGSWDAAIGWRALWGRGRVEERRE
jgi:hypothetical protein